MSPPYTPDAERNPPATPTTRDKTALAADLRARAADYLCDAKEMAFVGLRHRAAAAKAIVYRDASELLTSRAKRVLGSVYDGEAAEVYAATLRELDAGLKQAAPHFATTTTKPGRIDSLSITGHVTAERRVSGVTYARQTAGAPGNIRTWVGAEYVDTAVAEWDTPAAVNANVAASVAARWPAKPLSLRTGEQTRSDIARDAALGNAPPPPGSGAPKPLNADLMRATGRACVDCGGNGRTWVQPPGELPTALLKIDCPVCAGTGWVGR